MPSPKLVPLVLTDAERASLEALSRKQTASQSLAEWARVVLACASIWLPRVVIASWTWRADDPDHRQGHG